MAYFEGNAIHIIGGQTNKTVKYNQVNTFTSRKGLIHATINKNLFTKNHGLNIGFSSALSINGGQSQELKEKIQVDSDLKFENEEVLT